jgi:hypothetical protein
MFTFRRIYFWFTLLLFIIEVLIALFVRDSFVRPYVGDYLVVMLIYCFLRTFMHCRVVPLAMGTLLFAYGVELLQYLNLIALLDLQNSALANIILGNRFEWVDMLAYTLGIATVLVFERASFVYLGKKEPRASLVKAGR